MTYPAVDTSGTTPALPQIPCRLCEAASQRIFGVTVLGRYDVSYYRCDGCGSLQTEMPYWLGEAYSDGSGAEANLSDFDTGAAQRNLETLPAVMLVARHLKLRNVIDHGGGDGLLVRLLRDYGLNAYVYDRYARATYARGFTDPDFKRPDLITAFEVFEHFANPKEEIAELLASEPKALLISTAVYTGQDTDWWYLYPETGQHIFFYSEAAMKLLAERFGYALIRSGGYTLFVKPDTLRGERILKHGLRYKARRILLSWIVLRTSQGDKRDLLRLKEQHRSRSRRED